jgi:hypothetical protein
VTFKKVYQMAFPQIFTCQVPGTAHGVPRIVNKCWPPTKADTCSKQKKEPRELRNTFMLRVRSVFVPVCFPLSPRTFDIYLLHYNVPPCAQQISPNRDVKLGDNALTNRSNPSSSNTGTINSDLHRAVGSHNGEGKKERQKTETEKQRYSINASCCYCRPTITGTSTT